MSELSVVMSALTTFDTMPYDKRLMAQDQLDLSNRSRTSLFPWRGQFSPELIELFLNTFAKDGDVILDPFAGSGTVLFESARKGLTCYAAEINPSAVEMSSTAHFVNVTPSDRIIHINRAKALADELLATKKWDLFSYQQFQQDDEQGPVEHVVGKAVQRLKDDPLTKNVLANALIRYMSYRKPAGVQDFLRAVNEHAAIIQKLPYMGNSIHLLHTDARAIPLASGTVNLVITSPPYINVFNYHQNNRPAMELMGWDLLKIAHSEFGSNRKNRQNRFLTVVQYCLDMLDILLELRRLLTRDGRVVIVVGRESNVRGVNFKNGRIVSALATGGAGFTLELLQERVFTNRFGENIYEDILHLVPLADGCCMGDSFARALAQVALDEGSNIAAYEIQQEVLDAKKKAPYVEKSPTFRLQTLDTAEVEVAANRDRRGSKTKKEAKYHSSPDTAPGETEGTTGQYQVAIGGQTQS